ncbi:MAG: PssD/Cps14F family polysaccharide biosynthesis glycosyltransferase [Thomasclavelia ramosa]
MKIAFTASSGGHLEEISMLKSISDSYDSFLVTEKTDFFSNSLCSKVYLVSQINRKEVLFIPKFFVLFLKSLYILIKEKPDCIISLGALATVPLCVLAKILGKKVVYIESFARVEELSITGKIMYKVADLFIVQWEALMKKYPKTVYCGGIF